MIPDGWQRDEVSTIIASFEAGVSVNADDRPKFDGEIGVLKVSAVTYGYFDPTAYKVVLPKEIDRLTVFPKRDSILVSRANTKELVGASAYIDRDYPDLFLPDKLWQIATIDGYSTRWLAYVLASDGVRSDISNRATGTSGSMKNISQDAFLSVRILIPPPAEQRQIAAILSTWDEAITLTEQLIDALQRRKQALMQLLLTGAVRFPAFDGTWEEAILAEVSAKLESGGTPSTQIDAYWSGKTPWITGADFGDLKVSQIRRYITDEAIANSSTKVAQQGDILLVSRTGVGKMALAPFDIAISQDITRITPKAELIRASYLLYFLAYTVPQLAKYNQGTSINGVTREDLKNHSVKLPSVNEQAQIAELLDLCNDEVELLHKTLGLLETQKRGLMQQLLTGAVRVQVED